MIILLQSARVEINTIVAAMAAQQVIYGQVFINSIGGKTIVVDVDGEVTTQELKIKIQDKTNIPPEKQVLTF